MGGGEDLKPMTKDELEALSKLPPPPEITDEDIEKINRWNNLKAKFSWDP